MNLEDIMKNVNLDREELYNSKQSRRAYADDIMLLIVDELEKLGFVGIDETPAKGNKYVPRDKCDFKYWMSGSGQGLSVDRYAGIFFQVFIPFTDKTNLIYFDFSGRPTEKEFPEYFTLHFNFASRSKNWVKIEDFTIDKFLEVCNQEYEEGIREYTPTDKIEECPLTYLEYALSRNKQKGI